MINELVVYDWMPINKWLNYYADAEVISDIAEDMLEGYKNDGLAEMEVAKLADGITHVLKNDLKLCRPAFVKGFLLDRMTDTIQSDIIRHLCDDESDIVFCDNRFIISVKDDTRYISGSAFTYPDDGYRYAIIGYDKKHRTHHVIGYIVDSAKMFHSRNQLEFSVDIDDTGMAGTGHDNLICVAKHGEDGIDRWNYLSRTVGLEPRTVMGLKFWKDKVL